MLKVLALILAAAAGIALHVSKEEPPDQISFLAVGQGDCTVLQSQGQTLVVDCGPKTDGFDSGQRIIVPALYELGVRAIDLLILTHPDKDHCGGLAALLKRFRVGKVCISAEFRGHRELENWLMEAGVEDNLVLWLPERARTSIGRFEVRMISPPLERGAEDNEGSVFMKIQAGNAAVVLSGDASIDTETSVMELGDDWSAQLLKTGHHGSINSTGYAWIARVRPEIGISSCGRNNGYSHPSPVVASRLKFYGAQHVDTAKAGTMTFRLGPQGLKRAAH